MVKIAPHSLKAAATNSKTTATAGGLAARDRGYNVHRNEPARRWRYNVKGWRSEDRRYKGKGYCDGGRCSSVRFVGGVGYARLVGDPVYFPGLAAVFGEGLLEAVGGGGDVLEDIAD